jgi:methionine-rich copper-binding protein CopC/putative copper export protein
MNGVMSGAVKRLGWAAGVAVAMMLVGAGPAAAHPYLAASTPQAGVVAKSQPSSVEMAFTEGLTLSGCSITIRNQKGQVVHSGRLQSADGGDGMQVSTGKLPEGIYTVNWVAYGDDGHTVSGSFQFGVPSAKGAPPPGAGRLLASTSSNGSESAPIESPVSLAGRWLMIVAAFFMLGGALLVARLRGRIEPELQRRVARRWQTLAVPALGIAIAGTVAEALERASGPHGLELSLLTGSASNLAVLVRLGLLVACAVALARVRPARRPLALGAGGGLALAALALDGHVASVRNVPVLAGFGQIVHVVSAGVWVGGVAVLAACVAPAALAESKPRAIRDAARSFTAVALPAAALTCGTGIAAAIRETRNFYFLRWSTYGNLVIAKAGVVAIILALGGLTTLLARRAVLRDRETPHARRMGWLMRGEALMGVGAVAVASVLAGTLQDAGQPLPAQRGNLLPGAGFADVALPHGEIADLTLAPARAGINRIVVAFAPPETAQGSTPPALPRSVKVVLSCDCGLARPIGIDVPLHPGSAGPSAWYADVALPRNGVWDGQLRVDGATAIGSPTFTVGIQHQPGSTPVTLASVADLSGPDAVYCRSQELGALYSIEYMNIFGGLGGRKIDQELLDDGGSPALARADALKLARQHPALFLAPCGQGAAAAIGAVGNRIPTIVADPGVPVTPGRRVFRLAPNPYAEGEAVAEYFGRVGVPESPASTPKRIAAFVGSDLASQQRLRGLEAGLAQYHVSVQTFPVDGPDLLSELRSALPQERWLGVYLDSEGPAAPVSSALRQLGPQVLVHGVNPTPILAASPIASESFVELSGDLGREGQIRVLSDVDPTSEAAQDYANIALEVVGELPTIPGLEGYVAGQAAAYGLVAGTSAASISSRLRAPGVFSQVATSPWSDRDPASGTLIFGVFTPNFLTENLIPAPSAANGGSPGEVSTGQFFPDGVWESTGGRFSPLPINLGIGKLSQIHINRAKPYTLPKGYKLPKGYRLPNGAIKLGSHVQGGSKR